jgi:hypothetical protein
MNSSSSTCSFSTLGLKAKSMNPSGGRRYSVDVVEDRRQLVDHPPEPLHVREQTVNRPAHGEVGRRITGDAGLEVHAPDGRLGKGSDHCPHISLVD